MWYDKYPGTPPRGSPLETVFLLIHLQRQEADMLATRALVRGQLAAMTRSPDEAKRALEAAQAFYDAKFPFLEQAKNTTTTDHKRLMDHVKYPMQIALQPLRKEIAERNRAKGLAKYRLRERQ